MPLPKPLTNLFKEMEGEEVDVMEQDVEETGYEVEMNWNMCRYLPEEGSCQEIFKVIIAGHIQALYEHLLEVQRGHDVGTTPVRRDAMLSQVLIQ